MKIVKNDFENSVAHRGHMWLDSSFWMKINKKNKKMGNQKLIDPPGVRFRAIVKHSEIHGDHTVMDLSSPVFASEDHPLSINNVPQLLKSYEDHLIEKFGTSHGFSVEINTPTKHDLKMDLLGLFKGADVIDVDNLSSTTLKEKLNKNKDFDLNKKHKLK